MATAARDAAVTFIVNDRADVALAVGAGGAHLGQADLTPSSVRSFAGEELIVGYSTHNRTQMEEAAREPADYLALGPIFGTQSKERPDATVGLEDLRRWRNLTDRPLVAIGGITRERAPEVWAAGANSCAVIADMLRDDWRSSIEIWTRLAQREGGT
jgi:thiamine-phosphate pyrophosphorylase